MPAINDKLGDFNLHVEDIRVASSTGSVYSAKESQIFAGPPRFSMIRSASRLYGIASVDVVRIDQQSMINTSAGVGSPIIMTNGRPSVGAGFGKTVFNVPSLLRAIYAYYPMSSLGTQIADLSQYEITSFSAGNASQQFTFPAFTNLSLETHPGYKNLAFNLNSSLFDYPFGLLIVMKTQTRNVDDIVGYYLQEARIRAHSLQLAGPSSLVTEEVSIVATAYHPVAL